MKIGIAVRLTTVVIFCSVVIFGIVLFYNYSVSKNIIVRDAEEKGEYLARATGVRVANLFSEVRRVADDLSRTLGEDTLTERKIDELENRILKYNPEIYGVSVAFEPFAFNPLERYFAPYKFRSEGKIISKHLGGAGYQYFFKDWYQLAREMEKPVWTEPYFDEGGGHALMTSYSTPFYRTERGTERLAGVVAADISLAWLQELVSELEVSEHGYVFILSRYGSYIAHPDSDLIMNETVFTRAEEMGLSDLRSLGKKMRAGESGFEEIDSLPVIGDAFVYYLPLPVENWSIGVVFPRDELLGDLTSLSREMAAMGIAGFLIMAAFVFISSRNVTRPLRLLTGAAHEIASGNMELKLPEPVSRDEVGELTGSFRQMRTSLKEYIANLTRTTAAKERIESELSIARDIQMSLLPKKFPAFPERSEFDIFASIEPARQVGGDLYDFFITDDGYLCFLVGDVSGKGVPAAFFMAVTRTLLRVVAIEGLEPGDVFARVNDDLYEDNDSCMFVTLFLGILDMRTGLLKYANAGHNPPLIIPGKGAPAWIPPSCEPVMGIMEGVPYTTGSMTLNPKDMVFVYTDGVTEAMNINNELYSETRLYRNISAGQGLSPAKMVGHVDSTIKSFTDGAEQSDDIAMLAMQYFGESNI